MSKYEFSLLLKGPVDFTEEVADQLFENARDDGTPGVCNGVFTIDFHREAESLETAIDSAIRNVRDAGHEVEHVQIEANAMRQSACLSIDETSAITWDGRLITHL
jgi:Asp-tRNA(Asn)/Glu-tRNA(Gln) amidotransferase A subunit family amidase